MIDGYKDSTLGKIPQNWDVVTVKEITKEHKQGFYTKDGYIKNGIRLARITDLNNPKVDFSEMPMLNISDSDYQSYKIEKGDFLFARSGAIGRYGIVENEEHPAVFASYLIRFRFNADIVNRFFGYFFESYLCGNQLRGITQGNANVNINAENIKSLKFPLAPFEEQQKITEILSTVDDKIEVMDQQIIETQELKKGLMQLLLTKGIGHTEFKDSVLGEIPKSWEVDEVQNISKVIDSLHKTPIFSETGLPMVRVGDINKDKLNLVNCLKVSEDVFNDFNKNHQPLKGDILMTRVGSYGKTILVDTETSFCIGQNTVIITGIENPEFLYHTFNSFLIQKQFDILTNGSSQPSLSLKDIRHLKVSLPQKEEQIQIAEILSSVDYKLEILSEKKTHYQELKQGLMQQLLTGKIRVNSLIDKTLTA